MSVRGHGRKPGCGVEAGGGAAGGRRRAAAAGCEVVVVGVTASAEAAHSVAADADVAGDVGSDVDGAQQDLACPVGLLPWLYFLLPWCHWFPQCQLVLPLLLLAVPGLTVCLYNK